MSNGWMSLAALGLSLASACDRGWPGQTAISEAPDLGSATSDLPDLGSVASSPYPPQIVDWVAGSPFVFQATVEKLHASTENAPPPGLDPSHLWNLDNMVVVRIDQPVLDGQPPLLAAGSEATL